MLHRVISWGRSLIREDEGSVAAGLVQDLIHADAQVALVIDAFSVTDDQDLRGFMAYEEVDLDLIGDGAIFQEVEIVEIQAGGWLGPFQSTLYQGAGGASGAVFEDHLGAVGRSFTDLFQLGLCL
jgi:hypothetical protein